MSTEHRALNYSQEFIGGLSSFLAIGYLDLSYNVDLSLEHLRPLARAHLLELYLGGDDRLASDRPCILRVVPNVWVLNGEYVTAHERRLAERSGKCNDDTELPPWYTGTKIRESGCEPLDETDGPSESRSFWEKEQTEGEREVGGTQHQSEMFSAFYPEYRDMSRQGRLAREFFEDVVWKLPCRYWQDEVGAVNHSGSSLAKKTPQALLFVHRYCLFPLPC